jgi:hypothetical protein
MEMPADVLRRFMTKFHREGECWVWHGKKNKGGYGTLWRGTGRSALAHRASYEHFVGKIPDGKHMDHLCRRRDCVSPEHLEPVTNRENILRGAGPTAVNAQKVVCTHGHRLTPENTLVSKRGYRRCRTCRDESNLARTPFRKGERPAKSHCKNGHEFTPENTRMSGIGKSRVCRICAKARIDEFRAKKRQESA